MYFDVKRRLNLPFVTHLNLTNCVHTLIMTTTMKYIPCKIYVEDPASVWLSVYRHLSF